MKQHVLDIYDAHLFRATTKAEWRELRKAAPFVDKAAPTSSGSSQLAAFEPDDGGPTVPHIAFWIDVKQQRTLVDLIDTCAHEATHGAGQLFAHFGHTIGDTDEPHAYLVGWLTRWLIEDLLP